MNFEFFLGEGTIRRGGWQEWMQPSGEERRRARPFPSQKGGRLKRQGPFR